MNGLKAAELVSKIVDKFVFTNEERLEANRNVQGAIINYAEKTFDGTTERSKSRRQIAYLVTLVYLFTVLSIIFVFFCNAFYDFQIDNTELRFILDKMNLPFSGIIFFYFGSYGASYLMGKSRQQKKDVRQFRKDRKDR